MTPLTNPQPKILFVAENQAGGAGLAALRLFHQLRSSGFSVRFLVSQGAEGQVLGWRTPVDLDESHGWRRKFLKIVTRTSEAFSVFQRWNRGRRRDRFFNGRPDTFEITTIYPGKIKLENHPWFGWADIIHLHWTAGFLAPTQRWTEKRWVLSLHDAHPLTAVCHFPADCTGFESGCRECPQLTGTKNPHWSKRVFDLKKQGYGKGGRITLHAPSHWIGELASRSLLTRDFPSVVLPNLFPTGAFRPLQPQPCRDLLGLRAEGRIALFAAGFVGNVRKGFTFFLQLAESMSHTDWKFVIVGGGNLPELPSNCHALGRLGDLRLMAAAYSSADLFISTTLQDTVPATIVESQLCGTPVIGFAVGGQPEMVIQNETGYLAPKVGLQGLLDGMEWFQSSDIDRTNIAAVASSRWEQSKVVAEWIRFYQDLR